MRAENTPFNTNGVRCIKSPCINCIDRKVGCHSVCENYIFYRTELDNLNATIRKQKADSQNPTISRYSIKKLKDKKRGH